MRLVDEPEDRLKSEEYKEAFGAVLEDLRTDHNSIYFYPLFLFRRLLYSVEIVLLYDYPTIQLFVITATTLLPMLYYLIKVRPFENISDNVVNIFNELILIVCYVSAFIMNTFSIDEKTFQMWGYILVGFVLSSLLITWVLIMPSALKGAINGFKDCIWGSPEEEAIPNEKPVDPNASTSQIALNESSINDTTINTKSNDIQNTSLNNQTTNTETPSKNHTETNLVSNPNYIRKRSHNYHRQESTFKRIHDAEGQDAEHINQSDNAESQIAAGNNNKVEQIINDPNEKVVTFENADPPLTAKFKEPINVEEMKTMDKQEVHELGISNAKLEISEKILGETPAHLKNPTRQFNFPERSTTLNRSEIIIEELPEKNTGADLEHENSGDLMLQNEDGYTSELPQEAVEEDISEPVQLDPAEFAEQVNKRIAEQTIRKIRKRHRRNPEKLRGVIANRFNAQINPVSESSKFVDPSTGQNIFEEIEEIKQEMANSGMNHEFSSEEIGLRKEYQSQDPMKPEIKPGMKYRRRSRIAFERGVVQPLKGSTGPKVESQTRRFKKVSNKFVN